MLPALDDAAAIHDQDQIRLHDALNAVGNDERGPVQHQVLKRGTDIGFGFRVHRGGRIIQDQDAGILEQRARNRHALFLTAGKGHPAFADPGAIPLWKIQDHLMDRSRPGSFFNFLIRHLPPDTIGDVLTDGTREQEWFLLHDPDLGAQVTAGVTGQIDPIQR